MNFNGTCPILSATFAEGGSSEEKCRKHGCAWFDGRQCIVFSIYDELSSINSNVPSFYDSSSNISDILDSVNSIKESLQK